MKYTALKDFIFNGAYYSRGEEVKINTKDELIKLSEKGFIRALTQKEIKEFGKAPKKIEKKEEE